MFISRIYTANLKEVSLKTKIARVANLILEIERLQKRIVGVEGELHGIDKVIGEVIKRNDKEKEQALMKRADELIKERETDYLEVVEVDEALHKVIIAIREEIGESNWCETAEKDYPGIMKRYEEVYDFMEDIYDVIDKK